MVARFIGLMHAHPDDFGPKAPGPHPLIGGLAGQTNTRGKFYCAPRETAKTSQAMQQPVEIFRGPRSGAGGPELDETGAAAGLGAGADSAPRQTPPDPLSPQSSRVSPKPWGSGGPESSRPASSPG